MAKAVVDNSNLKGPIDFIRGTDNFDHKPSSTVINLWLKQFTGFGALIIGERQEDIQAAKIPDCKV